MRVIVSFTVSFVTAFALAGIFAGPVAVGINALAPAHSTLITRTTLAICLCAAIVISCTLASSLGKSGYSSWLKKIGQLVEVIASAIPFI
jgi:hypothetical protein